MALRIILNCGVLFGILVLVVVGLGPQIGAVELAVLGTLYVAIGAFRTRQILRQRA